MAAKKLIAEEMFVISRGWLEAGSDARNEIEACPDTKPLLPRIEQAHAALAATTQPQASDPRLEQVQAEEVVLDARHDDILRGIHMLLTGTAYLMGMTAAGADMIALRDDINPDGLEAVNKTYRAESGQTAQLEARLPRLSARLQSIQVGPKPGKSLAEYANESIANGRKLGELEDEKGRLQAAPDDATGTERVNARNAWIRAANALEANARMAELDESKMAIIFGPLWAAEQVADRRGTSKPKKDANPDPAGGGTPV